MTDSAQTPDGFDHIPEYFGKTGVTESLAEVHPLRMMRQAANEILRQRERIAALEAALEAAQEALGWHASACGEGSIPDVTVEALRKIEEVQK